MQIVYSPGKEVLLSMTIIQLKLLFLIIDYAKIHNYVDSMNIRG